MGFTIWVLLLKRWQIFRNLEEIPWVRLEPTLWLSPLLLLPKGKGCCPFEGLPFLFYSVVRNCVLYIKKCVCVLISYGYVKICSFLSFLIKFNRVCFQNSFCNFVILIDSTRTILHLPLSFSSLFLKNWILHGHPCKELTWNSQTYEKQNRENTRQRKIITHRQYLRGSAICLRPQSCRDFTIIRKKYKVQWYNFSL